MLANVLAQKSLDHMSREAKAESADSRQRGMNASGFRSVGTCHVWSATRETHAVVPRCPENRCVVVTEAGSYLRLIDFCITQLKAQGPSRTCNESKEEEEEAPDTFDRMDRGGLILALAQARHGV